MHTKKLDENCLFPNITEMFSNCSSLLLMCINNIFLEKDVILISFIVLSISIEVLTNIQDV